MGCASSILDAPKNDLFDVPSTSCVSGKDFHDCYRLGMKLGRGAFAQVRAATLVKNTGSNNKEVAVKIIDLRCKGDPKYTHERLEEIALREAKYWNLVRNCKHVVKLHDVFFSSDLCYFVMEKCAVSLFHHIESLANINEWSIGHIVTQMLFGVAHVHRLRLVHRDVKPVNFIVGGIDNTTVKLCDFGVSVRFPKGEEQLMGYGGTAPFMCPEMLEGKGYNDRADVWSLGVIVYTFLFGAFPYVPQTGDPKTLKRAMRQAIVEGRPPKFQSALRLLELERSSSATDFVRMLLNRSPDSRPSADDALMLPYILNTKRKLVDRSNLDSLRPMLYAAKWAGAFACPSKEGTASVDEILNKLQMERLGNPLPDAEITESGNNQISAIGPESIEKRQGTSSLDTTASPASSPANRSCLDTTASPGSSPPNRSASDWSVLKSDIPRLRSSGIGGTEPLSAPLDAEQVYRRGDPCACELGRSADGDPEAFSRFGFPIPASPLFTTRSMKIES